MLHPWDRQENEPKATYVRFLLYRDLGPTRTVEAAYEKFLGEKAAGKSGETLSVSGQWWKDCSTYNWTDRAQAWDIHIFSKVGREAAVALGHYVRELATRGLRMLKRSPGPESWKEHLETIHALCSVISPEVMAILLQSGTAGVNGKLKPAALDRGAPAGPGPDTQHGGNGPGRMAGEPAPVHDVSSPVAPLWSANREEHGCSGTGTAGRAT
jgi:hypothetical protein